jgi:cytidylate kinase
MGIPRIIAIDGPAASGKSTLGQHLAQSLGYLYFDTGVMYRAVTWVALQRPEDINDEPAITRLAEQISIDVQPPSRDDGRAYDVLADGQDITWEIRRPEVEANVSPVSAYAGVRVILAAQQRRIGLRGKVVMVGRDIGTIVLPEAELKIYLDASAEERARRRCIELLNRGESANYEQILLAVRRRDLIDSTRQIAPLKAAPDAFILNSDGLDAAQVLQVVLDLVNAASRPGN